MRTPSTFLPVGLPGGPPDGPPGRASGRPPSLATCLSWPHVPPVPEPAPGQPAGLSLAWRTQGDHAVAALSGELDIACAAALREQLLGLLRLHAARLVIDLSGVSYCDASGLAVLVGTGRRAELLGGELRLAAPRPAVDSALRVMGLHRRFDIFPTVSAAVARPPAVSSHAGSAPLIAAASPIALAAPVQRAQRAAAVAAGAARMRRTAGSGDLRAAVAALLSYPDAWRDADPDRRFAPALQALAHAYARTGNARSDHAQLAEAARSLLAVLTEHALTYSPPVAATASRLRRLLHAG